MNAAIPSDLLKLKTQFETWRKTRTKRSPIPDQLRQAAIALLDQCSASLICRVLRLHPHTLRKPAAASAPPKTAPKKMPDFFPLPPGEFFSSIRSPQPACRLLLERPDGSRLTIDLPALDPASLSTLCATLLGA
jgi:hypothetical protein